MIGRLGGIQPLLDTFFSFLCRKTDFYVQFDPSVTKQANMGFPPGIAEKMVMIKIVPVYVQCAVMWSVHSLALALSICFEFTVIVSVHPSVMCQSCPYITHHSRLLLFFFF